MFEPSGPFAQDELPVRTVLGDLRHALNDHGAAILRAPPGAGKTTLVPLALLADLPAGQRILMTQPRRLAARTAASRLSVLNQSRVGDEIGYQVRMERRWRRSSRIVVMTTGVLLHRLLHDPFLESTSVVVLDEFHERSLEMDVVLGMLLRLRQTVRPDLRIVVMSATLDVAPIARFLDSAPVIESSGRQFEVKTRYARNRSLDPVEEQVARPLPDALAATSGHVLIFLPGVGEIIRTERAIARIASAANAHVWKLYGDMTAEAQDQVLAPSTTRKIILATNVAETSLTIDGVAAVIDSGLVRVLRSAPETGLAKLVLETNSLASADQRAGRAGRQAPGVCFRLWPESMNRSRPALDTPEVLRCDLSGALLQIAALGESDFESFPWLDRPAPEAIRRDHTVLEALGALENGRITDHGRELLAIPAEPRLAAMLLSGTRRGVAGSAALAAALLSERDPFRMPRHQDPRAKNAPITTRSERGESDLVDRVRRVESILAGSSTEIVDAGALRQIVRASQWLMDRVAAATVASGQAESEEDDLEGNDRLPDSSETRSVTIARERSSGDPDAALRRAIFDAWPDRLARRRQTGSDRGRMVGGTGVRLARHSIVLDAELFVCVDVERRDGDAEVRIASAVERAWLDPGRIRRADEYFFNPATETVQAKRREYWFDLVLAESTIAATDREQVEAILFREALARWERVFPASDPAIAGFLSRLELVRTHFPNEGWPAIELADLQELARELCHHRQSLDELRAAPWLDHLGGLLDWEQRRLLDDLAPATWTAPSGNRIPIEYALGSKPRIRVKLQELFGLNETPRILGRRIPLLMELLGPNHRPQQITDDLASFWQNTWSAIRKELQRRYPKHHWPENPQEASATRSGLKRDAQ